MTNNEFKQIAYFPYINMNRIGSLRLRELGVRIWNIDKGLPESIRDEALRDRVRLLIRTNTIDGQPVSNAAIIDVGSPNCEKFTSENVRAMEEAKLLLFIGFLAKNNLEGDAWSMATSENFKIVTQNFSQGNNSVTESEGAIVIRNKLGYDLRGYEYRAPVSVLKPLNFDVDEFLILEILKIKTKHPIIYKRIIRSIDLFFQGYHNDPHVSHNARHLLLVAAFETLLKLPSRGQRKYFKEIVNKQWRDSTDEEFDYKWEDRGIYKQDKGIKKVIWADSFYTLRNHIIHGKELKDSDFMFEMQRHVDIAVLFFVFAIKVKLNRTIRSKTFLDKIAWQLIGESRRKGFVFERNDLSRELRLALRRR